MKRCRSRSGFTMIELLVATALSAMLMIGVLAVAASVRTSPNGANRVARWPDAGAANDSEIDDRQVESDDPKAGRKVEYETWVERLVELVRWDLTNARDLEVDDDHVTLLGYGCLDPMRLGANDAAGRATHRPVRVEYVLRGDVEGRWLLRRQTALDELTNRGTRSTLLAAGVTKFELEPVEDQEESARRVGRGLNPERGRTAVADDALGLSGANASGVGRVGGGGVRRGPSVGRGLGTAGTTDGPLNDGPSLSEADDPDGATSGSAGEPGAEVVTELDEPLGVSARVWLRLSWVEERPGRGVEEHGIERLIIVR